MDMEKRFHAHRKLPRLLRSAGLALFLVAIILVPDVAVYQRASALHTERAEESRAVAALLETAAPAQTPVSFDSAVVELTKADSQPQLDPIDYRIAPIKSKKPYTYALFVKDVTQKMQCYTGLVSYEVIGKSVQGREIYALTVGHGPIVVLVTAGVHARENANTPMVMQCLFDFLYAASAGDQRKAQVLDAVTFVVVPLVNPDGYYYCIKKKNGKKKTNAHNVDINRNFPCIYWGSSVKKPGNFYPGPNPGSEPETQAIMALFDRYDFALAVDVHSRARQIICQKGGYTPEDIKNNEDPEKLNEMSKALAQSLLEDICYDRVDELNVKMGEEGTLTDYAFAQGVPTITFETLKYKNNRLASPNEIKKEYALFNWPNALCKIAEFASNTAQ